MVLNLTPMRLPRSPRTVDRSNRIILDLCGGTGSWSKPYADAGYDVRIINTPEHDVRTYVPPAGVYGVLAAPPCTMFSLARSSAFEPRDLRNAMTTVNGCLRIIHECQYGSSWLKFWAMENPKGLMRKFMGRPAMTFQPYEFGDAYTKHTDLWGQFNTNMVRSHVMPAPSIGKGGFSDWPVSMLPELPQGYSVPPDMTPRSARRSITPQGFARAFFLANP